MNRQDKILKELIVQLELHSLNGINIKSLIFQEIFTIIESNYLQYLRKS